jgi:hypothetical protein
VTAARAAIIAADAASLESALSPVASLAATVTAAVLPMSPETAHNIVAQLNTLAATPQPALDASLRASVLAATGTAAGWPSAAGSIVIEASASMLQDMATQAAIDADDVANAQVGAAAPAVAFTALQAERSAVRGRGAATCSLVAQNTVAMFSVYDLHRQLNLNLSVALSAVDVAAEANVASTMETTMTAAASTAARCVSIASTIQSDTAKVQSDLDALQSSFNANAADLAALTSAVNAAEAALMVEASYATVFAANC